jgi:hypothetical protein
MTYLHDVRQDCLTWQQEMMEDSSKFERTARALQKKINKQIPQKIHDVITESVKGIVKTALSGSEWITKSPPSEHSTLEEQEQLIKEKLRTYKYTASVEGAGTGFGGFWLGLADFPLLLSIKMKLLFDVATSYGFDVKDYRERLYILHVFQLAFSGGENRIKTFQKMKNWNKADFPEDPKYLEQVNWQEFQQDYRDHIDLIKMLQMIPGFGAFVGAIANYRFLDDLGTTAMNAYRMRILDFSDSE